MTVEQRFMVECLMWRVVGGLMEDLSGFFNKILWRWFVMWPVVDVLIGCATE